MIKYLPLLLLVGCKDIHYRDNVRIVSGFYKGCTGWVKEDYLYGRYLVYMDCQNGSITDLVDWYNLEIVK